MYIEIELDFPTGCGQSRIVGELAKSLHGKAEVVVKTNHMELACQYNSHGVELTIVRKASERIANQKDMLTVNCTNPEHQAQVMGRCRVLVNKRDGMRKAVGKGLEFLIDPWHNPVEYGVRVIHIPSGISHTESEHVRGSQCISITVRQFGMRQRCMAVIARKLQEIEDAKQLADPVVAVAEAMLVAKRQGYAVKSLVLSLQMYNTLLVLEKMTRDDTQFMGHPFTVEPLQSAPVKVRVVA